MKPVTTRVMMSESLRLTVRTGGRRCRDMRGCGKDKRVEWGRMKGGGEKGELEAREEAGKTKRIKCGESGGENKTDTKATPKGRQGRGN